MGKSTRAATQVRISEVTKWLLAGYTRSQILRKCSTKWKLGDRQIDEYIHQATREIEEITAATAERTLAILASNLWEIVRSQLKKSPGTARQAIMDIAKLQGLDRIDISLHIDRPLKELSDEDLGRALMEEHA